MLLKCIYKLDCIQPVQVIFYKIKDVRNMLFKKFNIVGGRGPGKDECRQARRGRGTTQETLA